MVWIAMTRQTRRNLAGAERAAECEAAEPYPETPRHAALRVRFAFLTGSGIPRSARHLRQRSLTARRAAFDRWAGFIFAARFNPPFLPRALRSIRIFFAIAFKYARRYVARQVVLLSKSNIKFRLHSTKRGTYTLHMDDVISYLLIAAVVIGGTSPGFIAGQVSAMKRENQFLAQWLKRFEGESNV